MAQKIVAITGAGGGLGRELAAGFARKGYKVFGTAFTQAEVETGFGGLDVTLSVADITKPAQVAAWATIVGAVAPGLDVLVNNAGVLTPGPMELLELDAIRHEFEVNVFGSLSVINAFLPALRNARGKILQISSGSGFFAIPFSGPSSASKAAMESFADVLRTELSPSGVQMIVAQPGNMATGGPAKTAAMLQRIADDMTPDQRSLYGRRFSAFSAAMNAMQAKGISAVEAARQIIEIAERHPAPVRARVGGDAEALYQTVRNSSDEQLDALRRQMFAL